MYSIQDKEHFYLRLLLSQVHGAISYEAVRTINGIVYDTFEGAVRQLGLLDEESNEFDKCLEEAATFKMPSQMRRLFASILLFCNLDEVDPFQLLKNHLDDLIEDYVLEQSRHKNTNLTEDENDQIPITKALIDIEKYLIPYGMTLNNFNITRPNYSLIQDFQQSNLIMEELNYDSTEIQDLLLKINQLNNDQRNIYNTIIQAYHKEINQTVFFVDGPGGYEKTFLFNIILAKVRSESNIAIAVASSGIASLLLTGGRTAHSRFKIPMKIFKTSTLNISKQSELAQLIKQTKLIIWDEAPMAHKYIFEAVDRTFRDITEIDKPFGGIIFVMGGDFR